MKVTPATAEVTVDGAPLKLASGDLLELLPAEAKRGAAAERERLMHLVGLGHRLRPRSPPPEFEGFDPRFELSAPA